MTEDIRKLLGGYATGTLSPDERQLLFESALHDDELFAALSDEQALKDLLDDGAVRAQLLRATEEPRFSVAAAFREWFERPRSKALVATGAVLLAVIGYQELRPKSERHDQIAQVREPVVTRETPREPPPAAPAADRPASKDEIRQTIKATPPKPLPKLEKDQAAPLPVTEPEALDSRHQVQHQVQLAAAGAAASGPPPPPPPAKAAGVSSAPLRYELLLRASSGEFVPVPGNHEFTAGDVIRVRVTSTREGAVAVSPAGQQTVVVPVQADEPAVLPASGGITIADGTDKLVLGFAVTGADLRSARRAATSSFTMGEQAKAKEASAPSLTIEIPLRQRK
jgi:hypothetical protein